MPPVLPSRPFPADPPRVSAICIFHDNAPFLAEAIESVLAQHYRDFELLLIDDGSIDGSEAIARDYARRFADRIRYLAHPARANRGMSATRNLGFAHARGELWAVMDGDDRWWPGKLTEQVAIIDAHPEVGMVAGAYREWHSWAGGTDRIFPSGHIDDAASFPPETSLALYPLGRGLNPTAPLIRREVVERVGGYDDRFRGMYEDQVFLAKVYLETAVWFSTSVWLDYRRHPESCTAKITPEGWLEARRAFLGWFEGYLAERDPPGRDALERAVARAHRELDHPLVTRAVNWVRKVGGLALQAARLRKRRAVPGNRPANPADPPR